ncbi:MAG: ABC transporter ATP-binding protein [Methyloligellaceae bacterium]
MIIDVQNLSKSFPMQNGNEFKAVDAISFSVSAGECVAFIGPNGAGKSTSLKMLTGILYPTDGRANVVGMTPWENRQKLAYKIGIVFGQRSQLLYNFPVKESFNLIGKIYDVTSADLKKRITHLVDILRIEHLVEQPVKSLSLGQRMRCEIASSLLHRPGILFLDEPTIGLDVTAKALLREHLRHLAEAEDTTIILTSHDTGDIEEICQRVILINHGKILIDKPLKDLRSEFLSSKLITLVTDEENPEADFIGAQIISRQPHRLTISVDQTLHPINEVVTEALRTLSVRDMSIENAPLEGIIRNLYAE